MATLATDYCATVYYHTNTPSLDERITVAVPLEATAIRGAHLYFEMQHCSSSTFSDTGEASSFAQEYLPLTTEVPMVFLLNFYRRLSPPLFV